MRVIMDGVMVGLLPHTGGISLLVVAGALIVGLGCPHLRAPAAQDVQPTEAFYGLSKEMAKILDPTHAGLHGGGLTSP
jgi:hypothetical protein